MTIEGDDLNEFDKVNKVDKVDKVNKVDKVDKVNKVDIDVLLLIILSYLENNDVLGIKDNIELLRCECGKFHNIDELKPFYDIICHEQAKSEEIEEIEEIEEKNTTHKYDNAIEYIITKESRAAFMRHALEYMC